MPKENFFLNEYSNGLEPNNWTHSARQIRKQEEDSEQPREQNSVWREMTLTGLRSPRKWVASRK